MSPDKQQSLLDRWPDLFYPSAHPETATECAIGDGWYSILERLCQQLSTPGHSDIHFLRIKEKWGLLRVDVECPPGKIEKLIRSFIRAARSESAITCENCGCHVDVTTAPAPWDLHSFCARCLEERVVGVSGVPRLPSR